MNCARVFLALLLACFFSNCTGGYWTIQRSESFVNEKGKSKTIISLDPQIVYQVKEKNKDADKMLKLSDKFEQNIVSCARKNDINLDLRNIEKNPDVLYYDKLLYLKQNMLEVSFNSYSSVNSSGNSIENRLSKSVYVNAPKISYDFNGYSGVFGTRYFSLLKITIADGFFIFNHIVVDTDLAETVYTERKTVNRKFNQDLCNQVVYDSFCALASDLKM